MVKRKIKSPKNNRQKVNKSICIVCNQEIRGSKLACVKCNVWIHGDQSCSGLSKDEFDNDDTIRDYICEVCKNCEHEESEDISMLTNLSEFETIKTLLVQIKSEVKECKKHLEEQKNVNLMLTNEIASLKNENVDIRELLKRYSKDLNNFRSQQTPRDAPLSYRSRSRNKQMSGNKQRSFTPAKARTSDSKPRNWEMPRQQRQYNNYNPPSADPNISRNENAKSSQVNASKVRIVDEYKDQEIRDEIMKSFPINKVKRCRKYVRVTMFYTDATSKNVYNHLKKFNFNVAKVTQIKTRFEDYKSFIIECSDLDYVEIIKSEIWHPDTKLSVYGPPHEDKTLDHFPVK